MTINARVKYFCFTLTSMSEFCLKVASRSIINFNLKKLDFIVKFKYMVLPEYNLSVQHRVLITRLLQTVFIKSNFFILLLYYKSFLTYLICSNSTILGTNGLNSADVPLSNK